MIVPPIIEEYGHILVVREDLIPGGTKARYVEALFADIDELVYASPTQGGAQTALARAARKLGKRLTLFVAASKNWHPRLVLSQQLGADIIEVKMGFLNNVQAQAARYSDSQKLLRGRRVRNLEFGLGSKTVIEAIASTARQIPRPNQLWCAAGSGTLARGLALAWPDVPRFVVQIGHKLTPTESAGGTVIVYPRKYAYQEPRKPPFPSDPTYERKAYFTMLERIANERATFWNTASSAKEELERIADGS
jgi:1-aminocyclopropane-1-carboxylate deaminase/D-cysteine desulfhydrase-like pyridoxal-dependent ACC family enzyme